MEEEEEFNHEIDNTPIERKMKRVNIHVTSKKYEHVRPYMQKYCNNEVFTTKDVPRVHGCGANHGTCILCGTSERNKSRHKLRIWKKECWE